MKAPCAAARLTSAVRRLACASSGSERLSGARVAMAYPSSPAVSSRWAAFRRCTTS
jgi:hypothetical protein